MSRSKVQIVILNYNGRDFLEKFLSGIIEHSSPYEVVVADNNSNDESISFLEKNFASTRLIKLKENHGYAQGYNEALAQLDAEYFVLINNDVEVPSGWLEPMLNLMEAERDVAACQPKLLDQRNKNKFEYAGASGGFIDYLGYPFCRGRIFDTLEEDNGQYNDNREVFWATGACMLVRSEIFKKAGGFDGTYFAHMEEIDLCWRFHAMGYKVMVCPESHAYHVGGGTLDKQSTHKTFLNFRNSLITLAKNHPSGWCWFLVLQRMNLDGLAGFKFLLSGDFMHIFAILRAHFSFYGKLGYVVRERKRIKALRKDSRDFFYHISIVLDYFLKGKKRFSDLDPKRFY